MADIIWSDEAPRTPGGGPECGLACRGVWRELKGENDRRGWLWSCDKGGCPHTFQAAGKARA